MNTNKLSLSVLVPVFNEIYLVETSIKRLLILEESAYLSKVEVIIIDDCSDLNSFKEIMKPIFA